MLTKKSAILENCDLLCLKMYIFLTQTNVDKKDLPRFKNDMESDILYESEIYLVSDCVWQAEVWKSDFDAERDARERLHAEKGQLENEFKQVQLRNQQLLDEMESLSKRQFQEMQQRHSNQGYQHSLQQHLRVGQQNHGSPYHPPQQYPQQSHTRSTSGSGDMYLRSPPATLDQVGKVMQVPCLPHTL